jgi:hypothetical protein
MLGDDHFLASLGVVIADRGAANFLGDVSDGGRRKVGSLGLSSSELKKRGGCTSILLPREIHPTSIFFILGFKPSQRTKFADVCIRDAASWYKYCPVEERESQIMQVLDGPESALTCHQIKVVEFTP